MKNVRSIVIAVLVVAVIVGTLLYFTLKSSPPSGKDAGGFYQGVTAGWCSAHGGSFVPNVPAGGGPDLGSCTVESSP
jgi:hypothetical protein